MQLSHRQGSLQSSVRHWVSMAGDWFGGPWQGLVAMERGGLEPVRIPSMSRDLSMVQAVVDRRSVEQFEEGRLSLIYSAERRLQLAHAINDRSMIANVQAELDQLL